MKKSIIIFAILALVGSAFAGEPKLLEPGPKDKCPVCGMFVSKYHDFIAQISLRDGTRLYFDGAKDLFKFRLDMQRYLPGKNEKEIAAAYVRDYYSLTPVDATKAYYVIGSDVYGPMGRELIPFRAEKEALEFLKDHHGKRIVRFQTVTPEILKELD